MAKGIKYLTTDEEVKIAWDEYRLKILGTFRLSTEPLTVKQVADKMGEVPAKVHYHVQKLIKIDMLELVKTENIKGITAKYYTNKYAGSDIAPDDHPDGRVSDEVVVEYARHAHYNNFARSVARFRESMVLTDQVMKTRDDVKYRDSAQVFFTMHLTPEERDEIEQYIIDISRKYQKPGEGKKEYGFIAGITRRT